MGANRGIWANIALFLIMLATFYLTVGKEMNTLGYLFSMLPCWLARPATALGQTRVERLAAGNPGDVKPDGEGVSELRIDYGPGYRVYYTMRGRSMIILLAGGDKRTQTSDIRTALRLARNM